MNITTQEASDALSYQGDIDAKETGRFGRLLRARRDIPIEEMAEHILKAAPPKRFHTVRLVHQDGMDEQPFAQLDVAGSPEPSLTMLVPVPPGTRIVHWRQLAEWPTRRPGVIDVIVERDPRPSIRQD